MSSPVILSLPEGCKVKFIAEGAANLVFELDLSEIVDTSSQEFFQGKLLRVAKTGTKAYLHQELHAYWETVVQPLFDGGDLVQQWLVRLRTNGTDQGRDDDDIISRLNAALHANETLRREDFQGSKVVDAEYGMLVEDMRKRDEDDVVLEFKPKWLAQSPNAPPSAKRCRNCAREAHRMNTKKRKKGAPILCALDLVHCRTDPRALEHVIPHLTSSGSGLVENGPANNSSIINWLVTNTLLERLRDVQVGNDSTGPLSIPDAKADGESTQAQNENRKRQLEQLQLAMTLRDCTCFLRVRSRSNGVHVEAKLADLDKKNWHAKLSYWQKMERTLQDEGYYAATEEPRQITTCRLEREASHCTVGMSER
ncbi:inositol pentakisphosphate 2-kinase [Diplogelasinospora grovesii]|uniref:Inositol-pentakisphosphate 2-kinase n=1 Tax=Diplogelasinospora grovesii TaxID=303347 RepID=A0AAN6NFW8_9PEZI|nr:inositol pentakisphosphate 2-kinase [Diplogelasinospora grovesii]